MNKCIQRRNTIAAGAVTNLMAGEEFEFLQEDCIMSFGLLCDVTGLTVDVILTDQLVARALVPALGTAGQMPVKPDHYPVTNVEGVQGDRVVIRVTNPTGGAIIVGWVFCCD